MTTEERCTLYMKWKSLASTLIELEGKLKAANKAGDDAFYCAVRHATNADEKETAYALGDEAGWILADEIENQIRPIKSEMEESYKILVANPFKIDDYQSCCAYGLHERKKVKVVLLDGTEMFGIIYPCVYDNPQEMYLIREGENDYYLDEGWEVKEVEFVG